jgi:predicted aspartyl protease
MTTGVFIENTPFIRIALGWGQSVQTPFVILDTGFTGDLQVTPKIAQELGLEIVGVTKTQIANGQIIDMPMALAVAAIEGSAEYIDVLISENIMPLIGIGFLSKFDCKAIIDCKYKTVALERVK